MQIDITKEDIRDYKENNLGAGFELLTLDQRVGILKGKIDKANDRLNAYMRKLQRGKTGRKKAKIKVKPKKYERLTQLQKEVLLVTNVAQELLADN